jgi:hypothetical protein
MLGPTAGQRSDRVAIQSLTTHRWSPAATFPARGFQTLGFQALVFPTLVFPTPD